jgi:hypothetical protein
MHTNRLCLFSSLRDNSLVLLLKAGDGVLSKNLEHLADTDPRKEGSILQVGKIEQGTADYKATKVFMKLDIGIKNTQLYRFFNRKQRYVCTNVQLGNADIQQMHARFYLYALCDVLLMHSK